MVSLAGFLDEIGLVVLWNASRDVHWLLAIRFFRMMAFGQVSIILVQFFKALGISESRTGIFMALTLAGDVLISFILTTVADEVGKKKILLWGAFMMFISGAVFATSYNYYILLTAAVIGVISPSGGEVGPFRAIEESSLAHVLDLSERPDVYAWYALLGGIGASFGSITSGWTLDALKHTYGFDDISAYQVIFWFYSILGFLKLLGTAMISNKIETAPPAGADEERSLLGQETALAAPPVEVPKKSRLARFIPTLSEESKRIVPLLSLLFAVDAFASSLTPTTWISYYVSQKFDISESYLGSIFFITGTVASFGSLGGSSIAKRLGPLVTMVVTHLPSSTILGLLPLPNTAGLTLLLLVIRSCTCNMDVAPRQAFLSAVVLKEERTAVMGLVNVVKTAAQILGPFTTGYLAQQGSQWICFVIASALKVSYDLGILATFLKVKLNRSD